MEVVGDVESRVGPGSCTLAPLILPSLPYHGLIMSGQLRGVEQVLKTILLNSLSKVGESNINKHDLLCGCKVTMFKYMATFLGVS